MEGIANPSGNSKSMRSDQTTPINVTFVLPGDFRSGGVRVTVIMANKLNAMGLKARIACPKPRVGLKQFAKTALGKLRVRTGKNAGWLHLFKGETVFYKNLDELCYADNEIVIAVGSYMVGDVSCMKKPVRKIRFNHGMPTNPKPEHANAWHGTMPTITVSKTLIPKLESCSGKKVLAVIPNGIDRSDYYPREEIARDGIGAVYNPHPNKAPDDMLSLLKIIYKKHPNVPQYVFSTEPCPPELSHTTYTRYPSVEEACKIYNRAKCWLMTSKTEGLPGVALEAMSSGCVMVTSDNDGSLEIIRHNKNGLIAHQPNLNEYLEHVEAVLYDETLFARLSKRATETAESMTWERAADKMHSFLKSLEPTVFHK